VGLFAFIASMGIDSVIKRELVNNPEDKNNIIGTALAIKIAGSVLSILLIIITIFLLNPEPLVFGLIVLFSITYIFFSFDVFNSYFESQTQSKYPVGVAIFSSIVSAILKITFIFLGFGVVWLIAIYVLEALLTAIGMILIFINKVSGFKNLHFKTEIAKQIIKDSWPLMLSSFAVSIYLRIDQVMINSILGSAEVGIYAVAVKLAELWYFIPTIIGSSISPAIINSLKISEEAFENRLFKLYLLMISISLLIAIFVSLTSDWLIKILFGEEYISASPVLKIYIWSGIAVFLGVSVGYYLLAKNLTKLSFYTTLSGMITNVVLNIILIPNFGIKGAAIATLISYSISVLSILFFKETRKHAVFVFKKPIKKLKWDSRKILIKIKMIFEKLLHPSKKIILAQH
jgi:O-antigen/teichoic acid export membrane protein